MGYSLQEKDLYFYQSNSNGKNVSGIICSIDKGDFNSKVSLCDQEIMARSKVLEWCFGKVKMPSNVITLLSQFDVGLIQFLQSTKKFIHKISNIMINNPKEQLSVITNKLYLYWFENVFMNSKNLLMLDNYLEEDAQNITDESGQLMAFVTALDFIELHSTPRIFTTTEVIENS